MPGLPTPPDPLSEPLRAAGPKDLIGGHCPHSRKPSACSCVPQALQRWLNAGTKPIWAGWPHRVAWTPRLLDNAQSLLAVGLNYYVDRQPAPEA